MYLFPENIKLNWTFTQQSKQALLVHTITEGKMHQRQEEEFIKIHYQYADRLRLPLLLLLLLLFQLPFSHNFDCRKKGREQSFGNLTKHQTSRTKGRQKKNVKQFSVLESPTIITI